MPYSILLAATLQREQYIGHNLFSGEISSPPNKVGMREEVAARGKGTGKGFPTFT